MQTPNLFDLHVDGEAAGFLKEISRWAKFLAIVGFIMVFFMILVSLVLISIAGTQPFIAEALRTPTDGSSTTMLGVIYFIMALVSIIPYVYLFQFATKMKAALAASEQEVLNKAFSRLKSCFKFVGVFTIIILAFLVLAILALNFIAMT